MTKQDEVNYHKPERIEPNHKADGEDTLTFEQHIAYFKEALGLTWQILNRSKIQWNRVGCLDAHKNKQQRAKWYASEVNRMR